MNLSAKILLVAALCGAAGCADGVHRPLGVCSDTAERRPVSAARWPGGMKQMLPPPAKAESAGSPSPAETAGRSRAANAAPARATAAPPGTPPVAAVPGRAPVSLAPPVPTAPTRAPSTLDMNPTTPTVAPGGGVSELRGVGAGMPCHG
jgi:hypothetical protein